MKIQLTLAVIALVLGPGLALAQGCSRDHDAAALSCADGTAWNPDTKTCETTSS